MQSSTFGIKADWSSIVLNGKITEESLRAINKLSYSDFKIGLFYYLNNLNERYFPTHGLLFNFDASATLKTNGKVYFNNTPIDADQLGGLLMTSTIYAVNAEVMPVTRLTEKLVLVSKAKLMLSNIGDGTLNLTEYDYVGGFNPELVNSGEFYGSGIKQYRLANYFYFRLTPQYQLFRNLFLQGHLNILTTAFPVTLLHHNADTSKLSDRDFRFGYGSTVGFLSPVGPISFSIASDIHQKGVKANLSIGFQF